MLFGHHSTIAQVAQLWGCSEEVIQAVVENGTIPMHRAYLGIFGPARLDGEYVDLVTPDARMLNTRFDEMMGGPGWQERKKQEREQTKQETERIKAHIEEIHQEGERQQHAFHQRLSEMMELQAQRLYGQISENAERSIPEIQKNEQ